MKIPRFFIAAASLGLCLITPAHATEPVAADINVSITSVSSLTNQALQVIDLTGIGGSKTRGDAVAIELEVLTGATGPGTARTLTVYYAFGGLATYSALEMSTASANLMIPLVTTGATKRLYSLPVVYNGARYLYVWFDHSARDAGSTLALTGRINGLTR